MNYFSIGKMNDLPLRLNLALIAGLVSFSTSDIAMANGTDVDHMSAFKKEESESLKGSHHFIFRGEFNRTGYNNHVYLSHHGGKFWAIWSCSQRDGGHAGQHIRFATSANGTEWSAPQVMMSPAEGRYLIARGLWVRNGDLFAIFAKCSGEASGTEVEELATCRWDDETSNWEEAGVIGKNLINNYAPVRLDSGNWLMPYRLRELNRVDGVLLGGQKDLDSWRKIPIPGPERGRFTEANAIVRSDGTVAVHLRDNDRSGFLFRSISRDGGESWTEPVKTNFPDCRCKHYCMKLSNGRFILINNPHTRQTLAVSTSANGAIFKSTATLRTNPPKIRFPGHDKSPSFTYPHAIEQGGFVFIAYSMNRDDIVVTRIPLKEFNEIPDKDGTK